MRAFAEQCGLDSSCCSASTMGAMASLDWDSDEASESVMFSAVTLHCFGLPYQYARLKF